MRAFGLSSALAALWLAGVGSATTQPIQSSALVDLIPSDSVVVMRMNWALVRSEPAFQQCGPVSVVESLIASMGLPSEGVESIVMFSDSFDSASGGVTTVVQAKGLAQRGVRAAAKGLAASQDATSGMAVAALSEDIITVGARPSVERLGRLARGADSSLFRVAELAEFGQALRGSEPVAMAVVWPQATQDASKAAVAISALTARFLGAGPVGAIVEKLGIGRALTTTCSKEASGLRLGVTALLQDEGTATMIAGTLTLLRALASFVPPDAPSGAPPFDFKTLTVGRRGAIVSIGMLVPGQKF